MSLNNTGDQDRQAILPYPNPLGICGGNGTRPIDELQAAFPQAEVAAMGLAGEIGGRVLISCRPPSENDSDALMRLNADKYRFLLLAAHAMKYTGIATNIGLDAESTVTKKHLHSLYFQLSVHSKDSAATFIPLEESVLRSIEHETDPRDGFLTIKGLCVPEKKVFRAMGQGKSQKQIAASLLLSASTIASHASKIYSTLCLPDGIDKLAYTRRLAGALVSLQEYDSTK